jgi:hypothetical protein
MRVVQHTLRQFTTPFITVIMVSTELCFGFGVNFIAPKILMHQTKCFLNTIQTIEHAHIVVAGSEPFDRSVIKQENGFTKKYVRIFIVQIIFALIFEQGDQIGRIFGQFGQFFKQQKYTAAYFLDTFFHGIS